jgi:hypothetical protein
MAKSIISRAIVKPRKPASNMIRKNCVSFVNADPAELEHEFEAQLQCPRAMGIDRV